MAALASIQELSAEDCAWATCASRCAISVDVAAGAAVCAKHAPAERSMKISRHFAMRELIYTSKSDVG
jgi:hypothetical protein